MTLSNSTSPPRRRFVWLLWFALVWPLAQSASLWHGAGHPAVAADAADDGKAPAHGTLCELCLAGQAVTGGAVPAAAAAVVPAMAGHGRPALAADRVWASTPALAYRSRAPPITPV